MRFTIADAMEAACYDLVPGGSELIRKAREQEQVELHEEDEPDDSDDLCCYCGGSHPSSVCRDNLP